MIQIIQINLPVINPFGNICKATSFFTNSTCGWVRFVKRHISSDDVVIMDWRVWKPAEIKRYNRQYGLMAFKIEN